MLSKQTLKLGALALLFTTSHAYSVCPTSSFGLRGLSMSQSAPTELTSSKIGTDNSQSIQKSALSLLSSAVLLGGLFMPFGSDAATVFPPVDLTDPTRCQVKNI